MYLSLLNKLLKNKNKKLISVVHHFKQQTGNDSTTSANILK